MSDEQDLLLFFARLPQFFIELSESFCYYIIVRFVYVEENVWLNLCAQNDLY